MVPALGRAPSAAERELWLQAKAVATHAHAPYSGFRVGAVVRDAGGGAHSGVNVESASSPAGVCAERVALGAAITAGQRELTAAAVATADERDALPCGVCLQALAEFGDLDVIAMTGGEIRVLRLRTLLTAPFSR
jgi:homotetrameric cytidine deaminase